MADILDEALGQDKPAAKAQTAGRKTLEDYRKILTDFVSTTTDQRKQNMIDDDYYHGKQLTAEEVRKLNLRGQPDIVVNRTRVAVNGVLGVIARSHTDPKTWPRTPKDDDSASVATDCLRYASQKNRFNRTRTLGFYDFLVPGTVAILVGVDGRTKDIKYTPIRFEEFIYDTRSRRADFTDSRYFGIAKWMYADDVADMYPDKAQELDNLQDLGGGSFSSGVVVDELLADRPINQGWLDLRNKRVMVVELYFRYRNTWSRCVFYYGGVLSEGDSPYIDEYKQPCNPIIAASCYVDRDNNRYGIVRDMRDLQDEVNKRRSKLLHILNSSQIQARDPSAIEVSADIARAEAARPDGVIPYGWEKIPQNDMAQGQMQLLAEAKAEMERFAANPAILGRQGADTSGRALLARQQAGLIELAILLDQMEDWELRVYQATWARIKQFWDAPKFIRVTDDIEAPRFVQVNKPQMGMVPVMDDNGAPMADEIGQPAMTEGVLGYENSVAEMDVDIVVDVVPATATIMQEQLQDLMQLIGASPNYANQVPFEVLVELMQIPRKRELVKRIREFREQGQKAQAEQAQKQMEIAVETALAKIGHIKSQTGMNEAKTELAHAETIKTGVDASNETAEVVHKMSEDDAEPGAGGKSGSSGA